MSLNFEQSSEEDKKSRRRIQIGSKKKIGFVCSGGATKAGAFHLGVALALQEHGFKFYGGPISDQEAVRPPGPMEISTYVGSSAGSIIASLLAAGYSIENIFNSFLGKNQSSIHSVDCYPKPLPRLTYQKMFKLRGGLATEQLKQFLSIKSSISGLMRGNFEDFLQLRWMKLTGLFSTSGIEQYLREEVLPSNIFQEYAADLFVVATQLNHSRKVVFGKYHYQPPPHDVTCQYNNHATISEACASSTAIPFIYAPFAIQQESDEPIYYIDGETRDTLSTHVAIDSGCDLVFASYTHQPYHYVREIGSLTEHGLPSMLIQALYLLIEQKINNHIHNKQIQRDAILKVQRYMDDSNIAPEHRLKISEILQVTLHHNTEVDTIYIHPDPKDAKMFFGEHFTLSPTKMSEIVKSGFRATIDTLRKYRFKDRVVLKHAVGGVGAGERT